MPNDDRGYVNIAEAAAFLGVNRVTVWRWIRAGRLPVTRLGHRTVRVGLDDLQLFLERNTVSTAHPAQVESAIDPLADAWPHVEPGQHVVQFYERDGYLLDAVADFIGSGLLNDEPGIVVMTPEHRVGLDERLRIAGLNLDDLVLQDRYIALDAEEMLAQFVINAEPDEVRFNALFGPVIARASSHGRPARVFGEMVAILAVGDNPDGALRLEEFWNRLQTTQRFSLFCAYPMDSLSGSVLAELLGQVCSAHTHVIPAESYMALGSDEDRLRSVIELQQKARWLEEEIRDRKAAELQLRSALQAEREARLEAELAIRARDEFLTVAAHELKSPLTGLSGHVQLLQRQLQRSEQLDAQQIDTSLATVRAQTGKLSRLIDELLDVARLESGKLTLNRQHVDLVTLVMQVAGSFRVNGLTHPLHVTAPPSLVAYVDPLRFEQLVTNLLDNAIKFSPAGGGIDISLDQTSDATIRLCVRDRGVGIPEELRGRVFDRFFQGQAPEQSAGLGLGLHICRQITALHGGDILVDTPPGGGARFTVTLPATVRMDAAVAADD